METEEQLEASINAAMKGMKRVMKEAIESLKKSFAAQDARNIRAEESKFNEKVYKMACGNIENFHAGLVGRVGSPDLDFEKAES